MTTIYKDDRPIRKIQYADRSLAVWTVGLYGVTKIEAYQENGEMAPIIWFKIWLRDYLMARVNGKYIETIYYKQEKTGA